jgi:aspartate/methionine/tyrosine aminotransferase
MKSTNSVISSYGTTVFEVMSRLAVEHEAVNLGQGFPDDKGPEQVLKAAADALENKPNQYPPMMGIPELRQAVATHNKRFYDIDVEWQSQIMVGSGATELLTACFLSLIEPGDEVVLIEPLYDSYLPMVRRAGGIPKLVRVTPPNWDLPVSDLERAFSDKTKLIVLNSPMNPTGKVFSREELGVIADLVMRHDAYAVCDEVYEHIVFDGHAHVPLMTLPGMTERCVRLGSAGKTFSLTGWKVGYLTGPPALVAPIAKAHQFIVFTTPPNLQHAVAFGLEQGDEFFSDLANGMQAKRDRLADGLSKLGFSILDCQGTYFLSAAPPPGFGGDAPKNEPEDDEAVCRRLTVDAGVTPIGLSAFYRDLDVHGFLRFCFCKKDEVLDEALARLGTYYGVKS